MAGAEPADAMGLYLDNAATAPMLPVAVEAVAEAMRRTWGNPSSAHAVGQRAKRELEGARERIAVLVGAFPDEIYFTSGGTESNNLAIAGACGMYARQHGPGVIVTSALEHPSVTKAVRAQKREGWKVRYLDAVGGDLDLAALESRLSEGDPLALVSVMMVQSELGYRFPVADVVELRDRFAGEPASADASASANESAPAGAPASAFAFALATAGSTRTLVHTDAVQAFGKIPIHAHDLGVDLMSFASHKIGGPRGVAALYVRRGVQLFTTAHGGGQERGLRSGTEAVPLIVGFAAAAEQVMPRCEQSYAHVEGLKRQLLAGLRERFGTDLVVNSREDGTPYIVNFSLHGPNNRKVIDWLSSRGVCISASTACATNHASVPPGTWREKHPLALQLAGVPKNMMTRTYRVSFNAATTADQVDAFLRLFVEAVG